MASELEVRGLCVDFRGLRALDDVTLGVERGETLGIIGPNGAGKTTLVNVLTGAIPPSQGVVLDRGEEVGRWGLTKAARGGIARTFQTTRVFGDWTVRDNLALARHASSSGGSIDKVIATCGLAGLADTKAGDLAYGDGRKLGVGLALATEPRVLLLDEPAVGMSETEVAELTALIRRLQSERLTVILIDHNMRFVMEVADRIAVLDGGSLIATGAPAEIASDAEVITAYLGSSGA